MYVIGEPVKAKINVLTIRHSHRQQGFRKLSHISRKSGHISTMAVLRLSHDGAMLITGIAVVLFANPVSMELSAVDLASSKDPTLRLTSPENQAECGPLVLKRNYYTGELIDILAKIFSQADPFGYLVDKMMKIPSRTRNVSSLRGELNDLLQNEKLPRCYVPYAKALSSLLRGWPYVDDIRFYIDTIQRTRASNDVNFDFLPSDIRMPPQLLELFSTEILNDPTPPLRIFYKLFYKPQSDVLDLEAQLRTFVERLVMVARDVPFRQRNYIWYARSVWNFLRDKSILDDLKRDMDAIQPIIPSDPAFDDIGSRSSAIRIQDGIVVNE